jgi:hypothetical protein
VDEPANRVSSVAADAQLHDSAASLATAFGSAVLEPSWWPPDTGAIEYHLDRFPSHALYRISSTRHGDTPICVIGQAEVAGAGRASGTWFAPHELKDLRGLIGNVGSPSRLQAVVHDEGLAVHLIGYDTEAEIVTTAKSLRRVAAG